MENELKKYIERMNKYNQWEEKYKLHNKFTSVQKNKQYLELMEIAYLTIPQERIEMLYQEKLKRMIKERKMLIEGYNKFAGKFS